MSHAKAARVRDLSKRYGDRLALDGVGMAVAPGEIRGLLGPNGAGKTTLLRTLLGLAQPDAGSVELLGRPLAEARGGRLDGVAGFVEEPAFYGYLTGRANLELLAALDDGGTAEIDGLLQRVGLSERADDRVGGYSSGMRQRLGLAAALLRRPRLLLLDEPTSGLDPAGIRAVGALLAELSAAGVAVVLSSHLIGELEGLCHAFTIIRAGRVVWDGSAAQLETDAPGAVYRVVTSDDAAAAVLVSVCPGVSARVVPDGMRVAIGPGGLDGCVGAIVGGGLSLRRLELLISPLQSLFFSLTSDDDATGPDAWIAARDAAVQAAAVAR